MLFDETCDVFAQKLTTVIFYYYYYFKNSESFFTICRRTFAKQTSTVLTFSALFYLIPQLAMYKLVIKVYNRYRKASFTILRFIC